MPNNDTVILALDIGERRIGIAVANSGSRLASPLKTVEHGSTTFEHIKTIIEEQQATVLVAGLPRNLEGNETAQTGWVREFVKKLEAQVPLPVYFQDEALTSQKAEQELRDRAVTYNKGEVDALAATYILTDFLNDHPEV